MKLVTIGKVKPYPLEPEIIVLGSTKMDSAYLKKMIPEVKLRVSRKKGENFIIRSSSDAVQIFRRYFSKYKVETQEYFAVCYLDNANKVLGLYIVSMGTINSAAVEVRFVLAGALNMAATSMILFHNHPAGTLKASDADIRLTNKIKEAAKTHDLNVLDHVIVTADSYYSFLDEGRI